MRDDKVAMLEWGFCLFSRRGYTIDNSLVERYPTVGERTEELAVLRQRQDGAYQCGLPICHVSTCKLWFQRYSIIEYLKKFFAEIVAGNHNYGKLMLPIIGISANKL